MNVLKAKEITVPLQTETGEASSLPAYSIEYEIDSSRGQNHYNVVATIYDNRLYVFTAQTKKGTYTDLANRIKQIIDSLVLRKSTL